jgi:DNA-binding winged helix-turn-helix (wHTH) protein
VHSNEHRAAARMYCFDDYRLDPAARELWRDGHLLSLPRRVFDGLAYLIEHRGRAVGHDELIAALWGRVDVANAQVSQLIMAVRRAVGDDSNTQRAVRTISGFGYRWVLATEEVSAVGAAPDLVAAMVATVPADDASESVAVHFPTPAQPAQTTRRWRRIAALAFAAALGAALLTYVGWRSLAQRPMPHQAGQAIAVLPFDVSAPEEINASWMRLGVMDLVAGQLRRAGLPVPPSDSVVAALHATETLPQAERLDALRRTLGSDALVHGTVTWSKSGWTVELTTIATDDTRRRVESQRAEIIDTARYAAGLLLAALGKPASNDAEENEQLDEHLQRASAALLANELDTARSILNDAPASMRASPALRYELGRIEFHAGKLDEANTIVSGLLEDPAIANEPRVKAKALRMQGWIAIGQDKGWAAAERSFDSAVSAVRDTHSAADFGKALAERGVARVFLHRFDDAALDLGHARSQLEIAGDRQALGEMNNYLGHLEMARLRVADALPYFRKAAEISESFGAIDTLRYNLTALLQAQTRLLQWPDALTTSERLWALRERIENAGLRAATEGWRARALVAVGRQAEADRVLAGIEQAQDGIPPEYFRFALQARAELAWQQGRSEAALAAATRALAVWPPEASTDADQLASVALLHQRASIAMQRPARAHIAALEPAEDRTLVVFDLVAKAEWAAAHNDEAEAERLFREAGAQSETQGVPDTIVLASAAYVRWLLAHGRIAEASAHAGRIAVWADHDFDSALLQVEVFHASGEADAWARALRQAQRLAGERTIPAALLAAPAQS